MTGHSKEGLKSARKELGNDAIVVSSDARSLTDLDGLAARVKAEFDTLDLLFVNAGFPPFANVFFVHHPGLPLEATGTVLSFSQLIQFGAILMAPLGFRRTGLSNGILLNQLAIAAMLVALALVRTVSFAGWM